MRILVNRAGGEIIVSDCEVMFFGQEFIGRIYIARDSVAGGWRIFQEYANLEEFEKKQREGIYQGERI